MEPDLLSMMNDQVRSAIILKDEETPAHLDDNPGFQIPSPSAPTHTALKEVSVQLHEKYPNVAVKPA